MNGSNPERGADRPSPATAALPWYRKGTTWLVVVVITAVAAWLLAGWAESDIDSAFGAAWWLR